MRREAPGDDGAHRGLPEEVEHFCQREGLLGYLEHAYELIERHFGAVDDLRVGMQPDPETGDEWVSVEITVEDADDLLDHYESYTREWVASVPWPERVKILLAFYVV